VCQDGEDVAVDGCLLGDVEFDEDVAYVAFDGAFADERR
jgi:hypothetical protein